MFGDCRVNALLQSSIRDARNNGRLSMRDIVDIYQYYERFGHLSALELFEVLKRVPLDVIREYQPFFTECVKYVFREYTVEIGRFCTFRAYEIRDGNLIAMLRSLDEEVYRDKLGCANVAYKAPLFIDRRGRAIFRCFSVDVFLRELR